MKRLAGIGAVIGLFLIVLVAIAVQGTPSIDFAPSEPREAATPPPVLDESPMPVGTPLPENPASDIIGATIGFVFLALAAVAVTFILILVVRALMRAWRDRPLQTQEGDATDFEVQEQAVDAEPDVAAPMIRRGIQGALRTIDERPIATDAIIAAWVGLEESATDAGMTRGASETPSEFALRIITRRSGFSDAARELLRLYERVRFGGYIAEEHDRDAARAALQRIEEGWR